MNYWLDLFTGTTWEEFQKAGADITGFREHNWKRAEKIAKGDVFLCYVVGVKRWVGLLEVTGDRFKDDTPIWGEEVFPVRFPVKPLVMLQPDFGVPMKDLEGKVSFYEVGDSAGKWSGYIRSSPTKYKKKDGEVIEGLIREAEANPVKNPVDPKLLKRSSNIYKLKKKDEKGEDTVVTVPPKEDEPAEEAAEKGGTTHTEIQWRLLDVGSQMGLSVWAPKNDRGRSWNGKQNGDVPRLLDELPTQFDEVTNKIVENIDVLWLQGNAIVAAFEVEHSTSIYSGLLRMSDLLTTQPNIHIKLYLVAPDERFEKFKRQVPRPTFASGNRALHKMCGFLPYSKLCELLGNVQDVLTHLKPDFIDDITTMYDPAEEFDA